MSNYRARQLLGGLQFHHLGFGFFWAVTFIALSGFQGHASTIATWKLYTSTEQILAPLAIALLTIWCVKKHQDLPMWLSSVATFALSGAALLYFLIFHLGYESWQLSLVAGSLLGAASALFFLLWEVFFVSEGQQRAIIYIPLSAVLSIILYFAVNQLPSEVLLFVSVIVLPFCAQFTLQKSLGEVNMYTLRPFTASTAKKTASDLWRPILCVCTVGFVWKLVGRLGASANDNATFAVLLGFAAAALLVAALELFLTRGFDILHIYQRLFPALAVIFLLPSLLGDQYTSILVGFLMFGFEVVNLLLLVTCAVYTARHELPPTLLYAICVIPVLSCMSAGDILGQAVSPQIAGGFAHGATILLICFVLLSIALIVVTRGRHKAPASVTNDELSASATQTPSAQNRMARAGEEPHPLSSTERAEATRASLRAQGLSPREAEVAELLMRGHSIGAISTKLFISENTTRGHVKNIYKKLGIHSRQELVDMAEQEQA